MFIDWLLHMSIEGAALACRSCALTLCSHPEHRRYRMATQFAFLAITAWVTVQIIG